MKLNKHCSILATLICAALTASAWDSTENVIWLAAGILCAPLNNLSLKAFIMQELTKKTATSGWNETYNRGMYAGYTF
jgi:hypothetical protein